MLAYRAILSRIYCLKPFLVTVKCLYTQNICFVFYITDMFQSLFLLVQLNLKTPLIYTKISFIKLMFNFLLVGGHVDQIPKISGCQAKLPAVIMFVEMHQQPCHPPWSSYKVNFVFWIL